MSGPITFRRDGDTLIPLGVGMALSDLSISDPEIWRLISSFDGYAVSSHGHIWRCAPNISGNAVRRSPRQLAMRKGNAYGHLSVTMSMNGVRRDAMVSRLVAVEFLGVPPPDKDCALHKDDTPAHNWPSNLFWGSRIDNTSDMVSKNRQAKGERVSSAKITAQDVVEIRRRIADGANQYDVAADYGVTQSNISMIAGRVTWAHVK